MDTPRQKATRGSRACTVCRRLKMKCVGAENGPPCKRCLSSNHQCIFEESQRGKRSVTLKKHDVLSKSLRKVEQTLDTVIRSINNPTLAAQLIAVTRSPSPSPDPNPTDPIPLSPKLHSLPDNTLNPLGLLAEASLANESNLRASLDTNSPPVGVASSIYFKPGPMTILPLRRLYIERQVQPEMLSFVTTDQVVDLFNIYFENLNVRAGVLDPSFHSPSLVCSRSPFLLTTICALSSKYYSPHPDLLPRLTDLAKSLAFSVPEKGYKSVEIVQAYLLLSLWGSGAAERFERDKTWMLLGMAIRMATDLNLHRKTSLLTADTQDGKALDIEQHNRERTWFNCFLLDRTFSSQMGKPYTIREDYIIRHVNEFCSSPSATEMDLAISAFVQLQQINSHCLDFLYSGTDTPSGLQRNCDYMQLINSFDAQLRAWWIEWGQIRTWQSPYLQILTDFNYNYVSLVLNSFGLQNALESLSRSSSNRINTPYFFSKVYSAAHSCAILIRDKLGPNGHLRFQPDNHFVQMSYAVLSLLKLIRPELKPYLSNEKEVINLVKDVAEAMSDAAVNALHTPALYGNFLKAIIDAKVGGGNNTDVGAKDGPGDSDMSPSSSNGSSGNTGTGTGYHASSSFNSPQSVHSTLSHHPHHNHLHGQGHTRNSSSLSAPPLEGPSLMPSSILDYPYNNNNHTSEIPRQTPIEMPTATTIAMALAPAGFASSSGLALASADGEMGESSSVVGVGVGPGPGPGPGPGVAGGAGVGAWGLTMEDVLSSVFWDSMVVPGFNTDGHNGGFMFGPGGMTPRQVPGTPH